jgi:hypothetical protein
MHNCKQTKQELIDLALAEQPVESPQLLRELDGCSACREELAALRSTLHVSGQALRLLVPGEDFWNGYHERLRSKLLAAPIVAAESARQSLASRGWAALKTIATSSVRLPVPAALAAVLLVGVSFTVLLRGARASVNTTNHLAQVETRTVEVPVVQEKVVTRVVYFEKKHRRFGRDTNQPANPGGTNGVAGTGSVATNRAALSLAGFKPTDEVKLTIIRGSYKDQKR